MKFRDLKIEDKEFCNRLINEVGIFDSAFSFTNWFIWSQADKITYFLQENSVISTKENNEYLILCKKNHIDNVISDLINESKHKGCNSLFIYGITEQFLGYFKARFGKKVDIKKDLGYSDYIYTVKRLKYLKGRKLSKKRNLIHRFNDLGKWEVKILDSPIISDCRLIDTRGQKVHNADLSEVKKFIEKYFYSIENKELKIEEQAIYRMLKYYKELNVLCIVVYLEGNIVAFSAGTLLNDKMIDTHFELALPRFKGAYQLICREFANCVSILLPSVNYINREEDLGIDGLRQAKKSYIPDKIAIKYTAKIKI